MTDVNDLDDLTLKDIQQMTASQADTIRLLQQLNLLPTLPKVNQQCMSNKNHDWYLSRYRRSIDGFETAENDQQCVYSHYSSKTTSLQSAKTYCQSLGSQLAKINDIVEIQDILPDSILHTRIMQQLLVFYRFRVVNDTRYFWIDRTEDSPDENTVSERLLNSCSIKSENIDRNCITIQYVRNQIANERCIAESDQCSTKSAMPVCVDQHLEKKVTLVPPITDEQSAKTSVNVSFDYSCGDDQNREYHLIDDYCYKILFHEINWQNAKAECERDGATLAVPEKSVTLQHMKLLFQRRRGYVSSGFAHIGVFYNSSSRTVLQYDVNNNDVQLIIPDSNAVYDLCEKTFQERYTALLSSSLITTMEKNNLQKQTIGCGYVDLVSALVPAIRCDEIPCNRTATVICQKPPITQSKIFEAKRKYIDLPSLSDSTTTSRSSRITDSTTIAESSIESSADTVTSMDSVEKSSSISRDFAPVFFLLAILFLFLFLASLNTLMSTQVVPWKISLFRRKTYRPPNSMYSQLNSNQDFDLN